MTLKVVDMSLVKHAQALSSLSAGTQSLINNIINESNASDIQTPGGSGSKDKFFNHAYNQDPKYQGRIAPGAGVSVAIYYMPSNKNEYDNYNVIDKEVGMLSGRRRLAVRIEGGAVEFYTTGHPKSDDRDSRSNSYIGFTPVNTKR